MVKNKNLAKPFAIIGLVLMAFVIFFSYGAINLEKSFEYRSDNDFNLDTVSNSSPYLPNYTTWSAMTWNGLSNFSGQFVWNIGDTYYYSSGTSQYVLDNNTNTWSVMSWFGLSSFAGNYIWNIGDTYYYSAGSSQYVLDNNTNTWSAMTWNGLSSFSGDNIWNIGNTYYYSYFPTQYVLDTRTNTWSVMTWNGLSSFSGNRVWNIGNTYYYSSGSSQYVLDISTNTWSAMTWHGLTDFYAERVWNIGNTYYYSSGSSQYVLDNNTNIWSIFAWNGFSSIFGNNIWNIGNNYYYSSGSSQYVLGFGSFVTPSLSIVFPSMYGATISDNNAYLVSVSFCLSFDNNTVSFVNCSYVYFNYGATVVGTDTDFNIYFDSYSLNLDLSSSYSGNLRFVSGSSSFMSINEVVSDCFSFSRSSDVSFFPNSLSVSKNDLNDSSSQTYGGKYNTFTYSNAVDTLSLIFKYYNSSVRPYFDNNVVDSYSVVLVNSTDFNYQAGYNLGYDVGYGEGQNNGFNEGKDYVDEQTFNRGKDYGYGLGYNAGYDVGLDEGKGIGYNTGLSDASNYSFLGLIGAVFDAPIQAFTGLLNFDVFGINASNIILGFLTISIALIILRICLKGGN